MRRLSNRRHEDNEKYSSLVGWGASWHCHRNVWQGRSAPVLGRSNIRERITVETPQRTWQTGACCARGRAHSGGAVTMRPVGRMPFAVADLLNQAAE